jgi:uncharacterized membrane protein YdfJ with MMPL/SSD domain
VSEAQRTWVDRTNAWADLHPVRSTLVAALIGLVLGAIAFRNVPNAVTIACCVSIGYVAALARRRWTRRHGAVGSR